MKPEFHEIYEYLYIEYRLINRYFYYFYYNNNNYYYDILEVIKKSIETADKENSLRPDAKYFLIVNFDHLIVRPLFVQRQDQAFSLEEFVQIKDDIQADISTIVSETKNESEQVEEISGHQIMRAIDRVWKNLKTTRFELWG